MLIQPRYTVYKNDARRCVAPLGLAYLGAFLKEHNYEIKIIDAANKGFNNLREEGVFVTYGLGDEEIEKEIREFGPQAVGVSCLFSTQDQNTKDILKLVKTIDPNIITFTGGAHPTFAAEEMLDVENLDYAVLGEGELTTLELFETLNETEDLSKIKGLAYKQAGQKFINQEPNFIKDINELPLPDRELLNLESYFKINLPHNPYCSSKRVTQVTTSRGCPYRCVFCSTTNFWGNSYRGRNPQKVIAEIKYLKETYDVDEIQFSDDNITANKARAMEIFEGIKYLNIKWCCPNGVALWTLDDELLEKMRESGCYQLSFAVESGVQEVLTKIIHKPVNLQKVRPMVKKAQELGIRVHGFFICGFPGETIAQMYQTYHFARDCGFDSASFFTASPLVGSDLMKICIEKGYLKENIAHTDRLYKIGNITTSDFQAEEVQELVEAFNRTYNRNDSRERRVEKGKY